MYDGVDVADGAVETNLVEVVEAAGVVQVEQAAIFEGLGEDAVGVALLCQVLEHVPFINIVVGEQIELLALESDFVVDFQRVIIAVRAEDNLSVVEGEDGIQVGVVVIGDLFQSIGK